MTPYLAPAVCYTSPATECAYVPAKRRWNRGTIITPDAEMTLTIPVEGGISVVKRIPPEQWQVSDRRPWRHTHIGALRAAYSRTPYYIHYGGAIEQIISDTHLQLVWQIADGIDSQVRRVMDVSGFMRALSAATPADRERCLRYGAELRRHTAAAHVAMLHNIFHFGPDAIFLLVDSFIEREEQLQTKP